MIRGVHWSVPGLARSDGGSVTSPQNPPATATATHSRSRRQTLAAWLGAAALLSKSTRAHATSQTRALAFAGLETPFADAPTLIVAGPTDGALAPWARAVAATVNRMLLPERGLGLIPVGGNDGVTAANQFDARTAPDGTTAMLIPGETAIASLQGDPRAQFDTGHWLPLATALCSGIVISRGRTLPQSQPVRLACEVPADVALPARLGLSLLGVETAGMIEASNPVAELKAGHVDAVFLRGPFAVRDAKAALAAGGTATFTLGHTDEAGALLRDPLLPQIPTLIELIAGPSVSSEFAALTLAWRAVAAAAQVECALVLPWLSPAGTVAWWRKAITTMAMPGDFSEQAATMGVASVGSSLRLQVDPADGFGLSSIAVDATTALALRRWLVARAK